MGRGIGCLRHVCFKSRVVQAADQQEMPPDRCDAQTFAMVSLTARRSVSITPRTIGLARLESRLDVAGLVTYL